MPYGRPLRVRRDARKRVTALHSERGWASPVNDTHARALAAAEASKILNSRPSTATATTTADNCPASMGGRHKWADPTVDGTVTCARCHAMR